LSVRAGPRIVLTLMGETLRNKSNLGLASLCIGGGQGMAMVLEIDDCRLKKQGRMLNRRSNCNEVDFFLICRYAMYNLRGQEM